MPVLQNGIDIASGFRSVFKLEEEVDNLTLLITPHLATLPGRHGTDALSQTYIFHFFRVDQQVFIQLVCRAVRIILTISNQSHFL
jgi:hypothetical protein